MANKELCNRRLLLAICLLLLTAGNAAAQNGEDKIVTDRPDQSEASSVVPKGTYQLELGYQFQKDEVEGQSVRTHAYPTGTLRIGVFEWMELRVLTAIRDSVIVDGSRRRVSGMGPLNLGAKVQLWSGNGWLPEAALLARVTLPTGSKSLSPEKPEPHLRLMFSNELNEKLQLSYNLVYHRVEGKALPGYTASVSYEFAERFTCFVEVFGEKEKGEASRHQADAGILFLLQNNLQLDVALGRYITRNAPDFFVTTGISVRFPR